MNSGPGTSWLADLHYVDDELVQLDLTAIIARGARLRRRRLLTKVAVALTLALPGTAFAVSAGGLFGSQPASVNSAAGGPAQTGGVEFAPAQSGYGQSPRFVGGGALVRVGVRLSVTIPQRYGPLRALVGAPSGTGVWFTGTGSWLMLFHLSPAGKISSWPVLPARDGLRATLMGINFAVTASGVGWLAAGSTLVRINTANDRVSSWQIPAPRAIPAPAPITATGQQEPRGVVDLAVSRLGRVAIAMSNSSSVQIFDPASESFEQVVLPDAADQPRSVGFTRNGILGVGFERVHSRSAPAVLVVAPSGRTVTARVAQARAMSRYGASRLLVGTARPDVVSAAGEVRPLSRPANPPDITSGVTAPVALPDNRLGVIAGTAVLTFPADATSVAAATAGSDLYLPPPGRCASAQARPKASTCTQGYRLLAIDAIGDIWVVPAAQARTIELLSPR